MNGFMEDEVSYAEAVCYLLLVRQSKKWRPLYAVALSPLFDIIYNPFQSLI